MGGLMSDLEKVRKERGLEGFEVIVDVWICWGIWN